MYVRTCIVITHEQMPIMIAAADAGHADSHRALEMISRWLVEAPGRPKARQFLCLNCDATFDGAASQPIGFVVTFPTFEDGQGTVTGICVDCCNRDDLTDMLIKRVREMWPDATFSRQGIS